MRDGGRIFLANIDIARSDFVDGRDAQGYGLTVDCRKFLGRGVEIRKCKRRNFGHAIRLDAHGDDKAFDISFLCAGDVFADGVFVGHAKELLVKTGREKGRQNETVQRTGRRNVDGEHDGISGLDDRAVGGDGNGIIGSHGV